MTGERGLRARPMGMFTQLLGYFLLCGSAFAAGIVNAIAGGGTLLSFPALLRVGVTSRAANETSTVALVPGSVSGAWGFRRDLRGARPWLRLLVGPSIAGGLLGSLLLTELDERYFEIVVPWLLLLAALLFALQPYVNRLIQPTMTVADDAYKPRATSAWWLGVLLVVFQFCIAVYGGYFGAGIGILMLASLGVMGIGDINRMNAIKTILAACINGVSVIVFACRREVEWSFALPMAVAAIVGGYFGASVGRLLPAPLVRLVVILVGLGLAAYYFAKQAGLLGSAAG
jgi:uncharacterized membrane protein YfcA